MLWKHRNMAVQNCSVSIIEEWDNEDVKRIFCCSDHLGVQWWKCLLRRIDWIMFAVDVMELEDDRWWMMDDRWWWWMTNVFLLVILVGCSIQRNDTVCSCRTRMKHETTETQPVLQKETSHSQSPAMLHTDSEDGENATSAVQEMCEKHPLLKNKKEPYKTFYIFVCRCD